MIPDFEPFDAFRLIDNGNTGAVHLTDLHDFLKLNGVYCYPEELEALIK